MGKNGETPYQGVIIEESLADKGILAGLEITKTEVEPTTERDETPWLDKWTLHYVTVADGEMEDLIKRIAAALETVHTNWYADFKNEGTHYFAFSGGKIFKVNRREWADYEAVKAYGISQGIPAHQLNFEKDLIK